MQEEFEKTYHDIEKVHFWFKARRNFIQKLIQNQSKDSKILDIGCSSGILLKELHLSGFKKEHLFGVDISENAIEECKKNELHNTYIMDAQDISLNHKFDIVIASDCLEHLKNDQLALQNWYTLLKDNGLLIIFVPAYNFLWSNHDEINMHHRRYTKSTLENELNKAGFNIERSSYWNFILFIPIALVRFLKRLVYRKNSSNGDLTVIPLFNNFFYFLLKMENKLLKYINFPFGVSVFSIVKK